LYIGGEWVDSTSTGEIPMINPANEEVFAYAPDTTTEDADHAVAAARKAFDEGPWPNMPVAERIAALQRLSGLYAEKAGDLAELITTEMGSPIAYSKRMQAPIAKVILEYNIGIAKDYPFEEERTGRSLPTRVIKKPVGVVAAITPWNVPQAAMMIKLAPALLAGCTVVAKPGPETSQDAFAMAELFDTAGFPPGVINIIPAGREIGEYLVAHRGVDHVSFTGSSTAGKHIATVCGRDLRRYNLELGGKSALVMLDDADLEKMVLGMLDQSLRNSGQTCLNQTRILVPRSRHDEVVEAICRLMAGLVVGNPMDPDTYMGPMASEAHRQRVENYVRIGVDEGAKIAFGGGRPKGLSKGWYVEPTLFVDVDNSMRIAREEIFGPVLVVIPYDTESDAVRIANDSEYGLAGGVWGADPKRAEAVARQLRTSVIFINGAGGSMDGPLSGYKSSGTGRELGREGLETYFEYSSLPLI
jgi:aldehyde dehydrogenase (NAD+)